MPRRISLAAGRALIVLTLLVGAAAILSAQGQGPTQDGFAPVTAADMAHQEQLPATRLVFAAYGFVWVALLTYVLTLWRRLSRVERELADVSAKLEARRR